MFEPVLTILIEIYDYTHRHGSLPGLTWIPAKHKQLLVDSQAIAKYIERNYFDLVSNIRWEGIDEELLAHIYDLDFKHWPASYIYHLTKSARLESVRASVSHSRYSFDSVFVSLRNHQIHLYALFHPVQLIINYSNT